MSWVAGCSRVWRRSCRRRRLPRMHKRRTTTRRSSGQSTICARCWSGRADSCRLGACGAADAVRAQQKRFLKTNQKFPDYIDAGVDAWCELYDWHVKNRQAINATRLPDGRYGLAFLFTTVVLRIEQSANFIGWGYDAR